MIKITRPQDALAFEAILAKAEEKKIPLWTHLDLTYRCNLKCIHCYCQNLSGHLWENKSELTLSEIRRLLDELAEAGALYLTLSGGEIFLRQDFFEIAGYAKKRNFCLNIFTNGTLIDEDKALRLAELSVLSVEMSIYGLTAQVHDAITGRPGSFVRLLEAVRILKKNNLKVVLKSVLMKPNFKEAYDLPAFVKEVGADEYRFSLEVSPKNDCSRLPEDYQIEESQLYELLSRQENLSQDTLGYLNNPLDKPLCATGVLSCYISPYGEVYPCIQLLIPMGNIRENSFKEIWLAPSVLRSQLDNLKVYGDLESCRSCGYVRFCKKCPGLSYLEKHDIKDCYDRLKSFARIDYELSMIHQFADALDI